MHGHLSSHVTIEWPDCRCPFSLDKMCMTREHHIALDHVSAWLSWPAWNQRSSNGPNRSHPYAWPASFLPRVCQPTPDPMHQSNAPSPTAMQRPHAWFAYNESIFSCTQQAHRKFTFPHILPCKSSALAAFLAHAWAYLVHMKSQVFQHSSRLWLSSEISDFGLVKLVPDREKFVATRLAGTFGYLTLEYHMMGKSLLELMSSVMGWCWCNHWLD